ncbi:hypothetical protein FPK09_04855 [Mycobacterium tuberculosis]|nr:hypothetical protein FPK09_04855 [Mycobacterium tuberculosis]
MSAPPAQAPVCGALAARPTAPGNASCTRPAKRDCRYGSRCETCLPFALAKDCRQASSRLQAATEPDETTTTSVISMRSPGSLKYQPAT